MTEFSEDQDKPEPELSEAEKQTELDHLYTRITQPFLYNDDMTPGWKKVEKGIYGAVGDNICVSETGGYRSRLYKLVDETYDVSFHRTEPCIVLFVLA